jgi:hypothetical protein
VEMEITAFNIVFLILLLTGLKCILLPFIIKKAIEMVPLTREPKFHSVDITSIAQNGLSAILQFTVPFTKLIPLVWIKVKLHILRIFDENEVEFLTLHFDDEFYFNGKSDLRVDLDVRIVVKDTCALRKYLSIATIGTQNDMNRITVILKFPISISFLGLFSP